MGKLVDFEGYGLAEYPDDFTDAQIRDSWERNIKPIIDAKKMAVLRENTAIANRNAEAANAVSPLWEGTKAAARTLPDLGISALKGTIGWPESIVGLADIPTLGYAGKGMDALGFDFKKSKEWLDQYISPAQREANQRVSEAKGFLPTAEAYIKNPGVAVHDLVESFPSMFGGAALARKGLQLVSKVGPKAAAWAAGAAVPGSSVPLIAGAVGEGAVAAGSMAEGIRQQTEDRLLTWEQAGLSLASGALTGAIGIASGKMAKRLGIDDFDTWMVSGIPAGTAKRTLTERIARGFGGALTEGVFEEMPQSAQEQVANNLALKKPWNEGVAEAAAKGLLAGAVMGGAMGGLMPGGQSAVPPPIPPPTTPPVQPPPLGSPQAPPALPGQVPKQPPSLPALSNQTLATPISSWVTAPNGPHVLGQSPNAFGVGQQVVQVSQSSGNFGKQGVVVSVAAPPAGGSPVVTVRFADGSQAKSDGKEFAFSEHFAQATAIKAGPLWTPPTPRQGTAPQPIPTNTNQQRRTPLDATEQLQAKINAARAAGDRALVRKLSIELDTMGTAAPVVKQPLPAQRTIKPSAPIASQDQNAPQNVIQPVAAETGALGEQVGRMPINAGFTHSTIARSYFFDGPGGMVSTGYLFNAIAGAFPRAASKLADVLRANKKAITDTFDNIRDLVVTENWTKLRADIVTAVESTYGVNTAEARAILDAMLDKPTGVGFREGTRLENRLDALEGEQSAPIASDEGFVMPALPPGVVAAPEAGLKAKVTSSGINPVLTKQEYASLPRSSRLAEHRSNAEVTSFDDSRISNKNYRNYFGLGHYFTPKGEGSIEGGSVSLESYGKNLHQIELDIRNPFFISAKLRKNTRAYSDYIDSIQRLEIPELTEVLDNGGSLDKESIQKIGQGRFTDALTSHNFDSVVYEASNGNREIVVLKGFSDRIRVVSINGKQVSNPIVEQNVEPAAAQSTAKSSVSERLNALLKTGLVRLANAGQTTPDYEGLRARGGITMGIDTKTGELIVDEQNIRDISAAMAKGRVDIAETIMDRLESAAAHESIHRLIFDGKKYLPGFANLVNTALSGKDAQLQQFASVGLKHLLTIEHYRNLFVSTGVTLEGTIAEQTQRILKNPGALALTFNELLAGHANTRGAWSAKENSFYDTTRKELLKRAGIPAAMDKPPVTLLPKEHAKWLADNSTYKSNAPAPVQKNTAVIDADAIAENGLDQRGLYEQETPEFKQSIFNLFLKKAASIGKTDIRSLSRNYASNGLSGDNGGVSLSFYLASADGTGRTFGDNPAKGVAWEFRFGREVVPVTWGDLAESGIATKNPDGTIRGSGFVASSKSETSKKTTNAPAPVPQQVGLPVKPEGTPPVGQAKPKAGTRNRLTSPAAGQAPAEAKPVDVATPAAATGAKGQTVRGFHGSAEIARRGKLEGGLRLDVSPSGRERAVGDTIDSMGTWFTTDESGAKVFGKHFDERGEGSKEGAVVEADITIENPMVFSSETEARNYFEQFRKKEKGGGGPPPKGSEIVAALRAIGHDGIIIKGGERGLSGGDYHLSFENKGVSVRNVNMPAPASTGATGQGKPKRTSLVPKVEPAVMHEKSEYPGKTQADEEQAASTPDELEATRQNVKNWFLDSEKNLSPGEVAIRVSGGGGILSTKPSFTFSERLAPRGSNPVTVDGVWSERKGAGTEVMVEVAKKAVELNRPLVISKPEPGAMGFYRKLGFKPTDSIGNMFISVRQLREFLDSRKSTPEAKVIADKAAAEATAATGAKGAAEQPATKPKRVARGSTLLARFNAETERLGPDILSFMVDSGLRVQSKTEAKARGKEYWNQNRGDYDGALPLALPTHNIIYGGSRGPDLLAQDAFEANVIKEPTPDAFWEAVNNASRRRRAAIGNESQDEKFLNEEVAAYERWMKATEEGAIRVSADELQVGDLMDVEGEKVEVIAKDADTGEVTLKDGRKFETQKLQDGESIYVERLIQLEPADKEEANFRGILSQAADSSSKLRPQDVERVMSEAGWDSDAFKAWLLKQPLSDDTRKAVEQWGKEDDFSLAPAESVEEQKARLAAEALKGEADAAAKAKADALTNAINKPLTGTVGDIAQGDMLDPQGGLFNNSNPLGKQPAPPSSPNETALQSRTGSTTKDDTDYLAAVKAGDMETAQRMVDEAAKKAGYSTETYKGWMPFTGDWADTNGLGQPRPGRKGTKTPITTIKRETPFPTFIIGEPPIEGIAGFFSSKRDVAEKFGSHGADWKTDRFYLKDGNQFVIDAKGKPAGTLQFEPGDSRFRDAARSGKYDSILLKNTSDEGSVHVQLKSENIKSADPITRDAQGNVIPLSQRFNQNSESILQSRSGTATGLPASAVEAHLAQAYGSVPNGVIRVVERPDLNFDGQVILDAATGEFLRIEINASKLNSLDDIDKILTHEFSHIVFRDEGVQSILGSLTDQERSQIEADMTRLGYTPDSLQEEGEARGIEQLANAWRGRNWFTQVVGRVLAWASEHGLKMTRLAAEMIAARAVAKVKAEVFMADEASIQQVSMGSELALQSRVVPDNAADLEIATAGQQVAAQVESIYASYEAGAQSLSQLALEKKEFRQARAELNKLTSLASARMTQLPNPAPGMTPDPMEGISVQANQVVVGPEFSDKLTNLGVAHNAADAQAKQGAIFFERVADGVTTARERLKDLEAKRNHYISIKAPAADISQVENTINSNRSQIATLEQTEHDGVTAGQRADEIAAAESNKIDAEGKRDALKLAPVDDYFGGRMANLRELTEKAKASAALAKALMAGTTDPAELARLTAEFERFDKLPETARDALVAGKMTDAQLSSVVIALQHSFVEFDLAKANMDDLLLAEQTRILKDIAQAEKDYKTALGANLDTEAVVDAALRSARGSAGLVGSVSGAAKIDQLLLETAAISGMAQTLGQNIEQNRWLYDYLSGVRSTPGGILAFSKANADALGIGEDTLRKLVNAVQSSPALGSALVTLADHAAATRANNYALSLATTVPSISSLAAQAQASTVPSNAQALLNQANAAAATLASAVKPGVRATSKTAQLLSSSINQSLTQLAAVNNGASLFNQVANNPAFVAMRQNANGLNGLVINMIEPGPAKTTFLGFGTTSTVYHPELVINVDDDPAMSHRTQGHIYQWSEAAKRYVADFDLAELAHRANPAANPTPGSLGFDRPKVIGLRTALEKQVNGSFLEVSLMDEAARTSIPKVVRKLLKRSWFRQHDFVARLVGGIYGTDLRATQGRWIRGHLNARRVASRFQDMPDLQASAMASHGIKNISTYRSQIWNQMGGYGREFGSKLKVGFTLPVSGQTITKEDMVFFKRTIDFEEQLRRFVTEVDNTRGVREKIGGQTFVRGGGSVGDYGMPRHLGRNATAFIADIISSYLNTKGFTVSSDLSAASTEAVPAFWNKRVDMLKQHILDSTRTDRAMRQDPTMRKAEMAIANRWLSGAVDPVSSLQDLAQLLAAELATVPGINPMDYAVRHLNSELIQYHEHAVRIKAEREDPSTRNSGLSIALSSDNEFTKPAAKLELPHSLYDYGALTTGERISAQSRANHEMLVEYANALRRAIGDLQNRINRFDNNQISEAEAARSYGGGMEELRDTFEILSASLVDFEAGYKLGADPALSPSALASELARFPVAGVLALPTVSIRNLTGGQLVVYLMERAMGYTGARLAMWHAIKNAPKALAKASYASALNIARFLDKNLLKTNKKQLEDIVDIIAKVALSPVLLALKNPTTIIAGVKSDLDQVQKLGYDTKMGFVDAFRQAWKESGLYANREEEEAALRSPTATKIGRVTLTAAKGINAFLGAVGVENSDQVLNSVNLVQSQMMETRLGEVAMKFGARLESLGITSIDPTDRRSILLPAEWSPFLNAQASLDSLGQLRLFLEGSAASEGFQLENALLKFYQETKAGKPTHIFSAAQFEAVQRGLLAQMNTSLPTNRASVVAGNRMWRILLTLQGYPSDAFLKLINTAVGGTRNRTVAAQAASKLPLLISIAMMAIIIGGMSDGASEYWKRKMQGIPSQNAGVLDRDFWQNKDKFMSGAGRFLAANMFYLGDVILGMQNQIQGNRGFDPASRVFPISLAQAFASAIQTTFATYQGSGDMSDVATPMVDFFAKLTPGGMEIRNWFGANKMLRRSRAITSAEGRAADMELPKQGGQRSAGPTTIVKRNLESAVGAMEEARVSGDTEAYAKAEGQARAEMAKLENYYIKRETERGKSPEEAAKEAKAAVWRDYQEINPVSSALGGRRPTASEYQTITTGATGARAITQQAGISAWQQGANALFNKTGTVTRESASASSGGGTGGGSGGGYGATMTASSGVGRATSGRGRMVKAGRSRLTTGRKTRSSLSRPKFRTRLRAPRNRKVSIKRVRLTA